MDRCWEEMPTALYLILIIFQDWKLLRLKFFWLFFIVINIKELNSELNFFDYVPDLTVIIWFTTKLLKALLFRVSVRAVTKCWSPLTWRLEVWTFLRLTWSYSVLLPRTLIPTSIALAAQGGRDVSAHACASTSHRKATHWLQWKDML